MVLTVKEHAYNLIRERLLNGDFPTGSRISDGKLAKELGVSRSPIREAIGQLVNDGLVQYRPRRGAFVRVPSPREMAEVYEARSALEGYSAFQAANKVSGKGLEELGHLNRAMGQIVKQCQNLPCSDGNQDLRRKFLQIDMEFHLKILSISGNERIVAMVQECNLLAFFVLCELDYEYRFFKQPYDQHVLILEAFRGQDPSAAMKAMTDHIDASKNAFLDAYADRRPQENDDRAATDRSARSTPPRLKEVSFGVL